jgi:ribonuclease HI
MWKRQGWQRRGGRHPKPISNLDLWQKLDSLLSVHTVQVTHVLGHRGHPENEACDRMAVDAYQRLLEKG